MPVPPVVHATYVGVINQEMVARAIFHMNGGIVGGMKELHLMFQSVGGVVGDGLALYAYFLGLPIEVHVYNSGSVDSAAVLAYLGAKHRHVSAHGTFVLHQSNFLPQAPMGAEAFSQRAKTLDIDNLRMRDILNARTTVPAESYARFDLMLTAQEALKFGVAQDIREFQVPAGNQIFDLTQQRP